MSLRGGPFDFREKEGDLEKESPAGTLLPKNIRAHYYCHKNRKNLRTFSEPKKHVIGQNIIQAIQTYRRKQILST